MESEGKLERMGKGGTSKKAGERFYWNPYFGESQMQPADIDTSWIRIVRKQEGFTTGVVLIKVLPTPFTTADGGEGVTFKADIIASLEFPRQAGAYQPISDQNLKDIDSAYIK